MTTKVFLGTQEIVSYVLKNKPLGIERLVSENTISAINGKSVICLDGITALGSGVLCCAYYNNTSLTELPDFSNIETVEKYGLYSCFDGCTNVTGQLDFSSLTNITGDSAFYNAFINCSNITGHLDLSSCETITGNMACYNAFNNCSGITSVDLHNLRRIDTYYSCNNMFSGCTGITGHLNLGSLTQITNCAYGCINMFGNCTGITSVDLHNLVTIQSNQNACSNMFSGCTGIVSVDLRKLENVSSPYSCTSMFSGCTSLRMFKFESVKQMNNYNTTFANIFQDCTSLTDVYFYALLSSNFSVGLAKTGLVNMLKNVTGCRVHFPKKLETICSTLDDFINGFGGTNTVISYELVTSLTGNDNNTYNRQEKDSTSTAIAWNSSGILYYTNYTNGEPQVGDSIYSDESCTTVVTNINSIA